MSKQYKMDLLKDKEPEGELLYGMEVSNELKEKYSKMPLNEVLNEINDFGQVYKNKRRDRI